jgi:hypothetical protein
MNLTAYQIDLGKAALLRQLVSRWSKQTVLLSRDEC